jgi:hypothetical protein
MTLKRTQDLRRLRHCLAFSIALALLGCVGAVSSYAWTERNRDSRTQEISKPSPLLQPGVSFDIFSASFFKGQDNLLTLGDSFLSFKRMNFPPTVVINQADRTIFKFSGVMLGFVSKEEIKNCSFGATNLPDSAILEQISIDSEFDHRIILVLPTTGSILDIKLTGENSEPLDRDALRLSLVKSKALFDKELLETKATVTKSQISEEKDGQQSYEVIFPNEGKLQQVILSADFELGTLKVDVLRTK